MLKEAIKMAKEAIRMSFEEHSTFQDSDIAMKINYSFNRKYEGDCLVIVGKFAEWADKWNCMGSFLIYEHIYGDIQTTIFKLNT